MMWAQDVTIVRKAKTMKIVPNALQVCQVGGKRDFFASFIYHDHAYRLASSIFGAFLGAFP